MCKNKDNRVVIGSDDDDTGGAVTITCFKVAKLIFINKCRYVPEMTSRG